MRKEKWRKTDSSVIIQDNRFLEFRFNYEPELDKHQALQFSGTQENIKEN